MFKSSIRENHSLEQSSVQLLGFPSPSLSPCLVSFVRVDGNENTNNSSLWEPKQGHFSWCGNPSARQNLDGTYLLNTVFGRYYWCRQIDMETV
jgi:hypothetical protein